MINVGRFGFVSNMCRTVVLKDVGRDLITDVNPFTLRVSLESIVCHSHTFENIF